MTEKNYPETTSAVDIVFTDGEVKTYYNTAGIGLGQFLAQQAAQTGILVLFNQHTSHSIPVARINEYTIRPLAEGELPPWQKEEGQ